MSKLADRIDELIGKATDSDLSDSGRYFSGTCYNFTECAHGDCGEYSNGSPDGRLVEALWNNRYKIAAALRAHEQENGDG